MSLHTCAVGTDLAPCECLRGVDSGAPLPATSPAIVYESHGNAVADYAQAEEHLSAQKESAAQSRRGCVAGRCQGEVKRRAHQQQDADATANVTEIIQTAVDGECEKGVRRRSLS